MANSTAATLIGYGLQAAKIGDDTGIAGLDTSVALVRIVDRENRNFILAPNAFNQPGWDFMIGDTGFTVKSAKTITGTANVGDTTVAVSDTTDFSATGGAAVIFTANVPNVILYTGRSVASGAGNLTGVTLLSFTHNANDAIYNLYKMPPDFGRPRGERFKSDGLTINTIPYVYGGTGVPRSGYYFSLFFDPVASLWYCWLPRDQSGQADMRYDKIATVITANTQAVDVPVDYEEYIVQKVAAHVMRILSKEDKKIADAEAQAVAVLNNAFARRSIAKRVTLTRQPVRSPSFLNSGHYMDSDGNIY